MEKVAVIALPEASSSSVSEIVTVVLWKGGDLSAFRTWVSIRRCLGHLRDILSPVYNRRLYRLADCNWSLDKFPRRRCCCMMAKSLYLNVRYFSAMPLQGLLARFGTLLDCTKPLEKSVQLPHDERADVEFLRLMKMHG